MDGAGRAGAGPAQGAVWLLRHGQTPWSLSGRHTGRTDVALTEEGRREAAAVGASLPTFDLVLTSPLARAAETCRLAGFAGQAHLDEDLVEWDYGEYEGRTTEEIRRERPGWNLFADGVPGGETAAEVGRRADRVISRVRDSTGDTLLVAHGHVLRILASRWVGLPPAGGRMVALDPASVSVLGWERELPVISRWNVPAPAG